MISYGPQDRSKLDVKFEKELLVAPPDLEEDDPLAQPEPPGWRAPTAAQEARDPCSYLLLSPAGFSFLPSWDPLARMR